MRGFCPSRPPVVVVFGAPSHQNTGTKQIHLTRTKLCSLTRTSMQQPAAVTPGAQEINNN